MLRRKVLGCLAVGVMIIAPLVRAQEAPQSDPEVMYRRYLKFPSYVKGGSIEPHWMADGSSFWYADGAPDNTIIFKVDPKANTKTPLFDTARLRRALRYVVTHGLSSSVLPSINVLFVDL